MTERERERALQWDILDVEEGIENIFKWSIPP
jgi:hypothetical protein